MKNYFYLTNCVNSTGELINNMVDTAREVTRRTFFKYVDWKYISSMLGYETHPKQGLMLCNDYHVSYYKGKYAGKNCYYICWSGIEYIFVKGN